MHLNATETATMLASLRYYQQTMVRDAGMKPDHQTEWAYTYFPDFFDEDMPMNSDEINDLCEKINAASECPVCGE